MGGPVLTILMFFLFTNKKTSKLELERKRFSDIILLFIVTAGYE